MNREGELAPRDAAALGMVVILSLLFIVLLHIAYYRWAAGVFLFVFLAWAFNLRYSNSIEVVFFIGSLVEFIVFQRWIMGGTLLVLAIAGFFVRHDYRAA